jgi:retron-type reverse transcriptase
MKTYNNLFPEIYSFDNLHDAYVRARRGKRHQADVLRFEQNLEGELIQLQNELIWREYETGPYRRFHVHEPKKRLVAALPFRDRVVQHSLIAAIEPIWESRFIDQSYACRPGRGVHRGADKAQQWLREVRATHGRVYALKADVAGYFASIDHDVLRTQLERRIACRPTLYLLLGIIETWHPGLPIGNLTSQLCANIYLHDFDVFAKQHVGARRYMRYMDDWLIVDHDKARLHAQRRVLEDWLHDNLRLQLNNKTQIFPVSPRHGRGLDFLGYRIWPTHRKIRKNSVKRMQKKLRALERRYAAGDIDLVDIEPVIQSWVAHASHASSYQIRRAVLERAVFKRQ